MRNYLVVLFLSLLFPISALGYTSSNLYEDTSDDTANFGSNSLYTQDEYYRTIEQVRDATVLVADKGGFGSGIVITPEGLILTNYHIIHETVIENLKIWFYAKDELGYYTVDLIGIDPFADIALLQINNMPPDKLPLVYLELETDEDNYSLAQEVWAIGHPLGMSWTATRGVINSYERASFITAYVRLIQHTALIQKGNSGGPLVDKDGRVVGVNTYVTKPDESLGFGYATRSDDVFFVVQNLIDHGVVLRPAMGIQTTNLNEFSVKAVNERYGANKVPSGIYGVIIYNLINPETGEVQSEWAINQGLKELDVLIAFNDHIINHNNDLHTAIRDHKPGDIIRLMLIREGQFMFLDYKLTSLAFDSYMEYYNKRRSDLENKPNKKEEQPTPPPEEDEESPVEEEEVEPTQ
jgi:serine protease Do